MKLEKIVPDTSVIIESILSKKIRSKEYDITKIIIPEAVIAELEHQANEGKTTGLIGLEEIKYLRELVEDISFSGSRPRSSDIKYAKLGEIDASIRQIAFEEDAYLITADNVQAKVAGSKGIKCILIPKQKKSDKIKLENFFDDSTMSVHLKENIIPTAKKGFPGNWDFIRLQENKITSQEIKDISKEILEEARSRSDGFIEIERPGSTIVQLGKFRIVITKPPFSDGWEITAVRPVKQTDIEDYKLSDKLIKRLDTQAEGILIAGSPGMGKSTFAAALCKFYQQKDKIVKTVEAPRDLVLPEEVTQYAISHGSSEEVHDILLLSRPDYTLFDEMRNIEDFKLYSDLRLAGIGLAGVIHATDPIDAIQRFVGKIELGVIPHVIDTVLFIKDGQVNKVLSLKMEVKVPSGMTEADLARPIVTVTDFETDKLEFELYTYGEETVVVPVTEQQEKPGILKLLKDPLIRYFQMFADEVDVDVISSSKAQVYVPEYAIPGIIGKGGKHIDEIEKELGIKIDILELSNSSNNDKKKGRKNRKKNKKRNKR